MLTLPLQAVAMDVEPTTAPAPTEVRTLYLRPVPQRPAASQGVRVVRPAPLATTGVGAAQRCPMRFLASSGARAVVASADAGRCVWLVQGAPGAGLTLTLDGTVGAPSPVRAIRILRADGQPLQELAGPIERGTRVEGLPATFVLQIDADPASARALYAHVSVAPQADGRSYWNW